MIAEHQPWCARPNVPHPACRRELAAVIVAPGQTVVVGISKAAEVPALITVATTTGARSHLLALHVEAAHVVGEALGEAVELVTKPG